MPRNVSPAKKAFSRLVPKGPVPYKALATKKSANRLGAEGPKKSTPAKKSAAKKSGTRKGR